MKNVEKMTQNERINHYENLKINDEKNGCQMCGAPISKLINNNTIDNWGAKLCQPCYDIEEGQI